MSLPPIYVDAALRCVTPLCAARERAGLAFDMPDGTVVRLAITDHDVEALAKLLAGQPGANQAREAAHG